MKNTKQKSINFCKYLFYFLIDSLIIDICFLIFINIVSYLSPKSTEINFITFTTFLLIFIYIILKIVSIKTKNIFIKILPISYWQLLTAVHFLIKMTEFNSKLPLTSQILMLALTFIGISSVDKVYDTYKKLEE